MKKVIAVLCVIALSVCFTSSALAEIPVSEYLHDVAPSGIVPFDTSVPSKTWSWSDGTYYGSLVGVKNWTYTKYTFTPNSSGAIHFWLQAGCGIQDSFTVRIYDASTKKQVASKSYDTSDDAVIDVKSSFTKLTTGKKYYIRISHGSGIGLYGGSKIYVNNSKNFDV